MDRRGVCHRRTDRRADGNLDANDRSAATDRAKSCLWRAGGGAGRNGALFPLLSTRKPIAPPGDDGISMPRSAPGLIDVYRIAHGIRKTPGPLADAAHGL